MVTMNQSEYAKHINVSRQRVNELVKSGRLVLNSTGRIIVEDSDRELERTINRAKERSNRKGGDRYGGETKPNPSELQSGPRSRISLADSQILKNIEDAKTKRFLLEKMEGMHVLVSSVEQTYFDLARQLRDMILGLPEKKGDEWHMVRNLFEFKLRIRRDIEEALRNAERDNDQE
jgi:hypothetical protein